MQGQLRGEALSVSIETECAHCRQPLHIEIDSALRYRVADPGAEPLVFVPLVDVDRLADPSIIDAL